MQPIETIRAMFPRPQGDEEAILDVVGTLLYAIDAKKHGAVIGTKPTVNYDELLRQATFPAHLGTTADVCKQITALYDGVDLWSHPQMQVNVVPPPTTLSIAMATLAARYNENAIWDHYGMSAAQSEVLAIGMLADLIGLPKASVGGIFTFGGTACNLYAARVGIEKADPDAKHTGIRDRIHFYASDIAHYSIQSAAIWTGIGLDNIKVIPSDEDNVIDIEALEAAMRQTIADGARIGTIFATMGTTDAFGIDPLRAMVALRDRMQHEVGYAIHVHADAVIGWPYLTFKGDEHLRELPHPLQDEIRSIMGRMAELQYADSVGIDFHKTGWAPYLCSAFVVRDKRDLFLLEKFKKDMPYLYHGTGYQPGICTLESSRPNYAQKALANMLLFGKEGYEILITHLLGVADYLRDRIERSLDIAVLNRHNPAFVTDLRIYPETKYDDDGLVLWDRELHDQTPGAFTERVNAYNRRIVQCLVERAEQRGTSMLSYTDSYKTTREQRPLVALKSYPMSPFTDNVHMDTMLRDLYAAKAQVDAQA
jgi:L-2,4-diaminobutyrate decarboxylase